MPRRRHRKTMRGGFLDSVSNTLSSWWDKAKTSLSGSSSAPSYSPSLVPMSAPPVAATYGGRRRTFRKMRGGFSDNESNSSLARNAMPLSGGKSRRRHRRKKH